MSCQIMGLTVHVLSDHGWTVHVMSDHGVTVHVLSDRGIDSSCTVRPCD